MNRQLDQLVRDAAPVSDQAVHDLPLDAAEAQLRAAIAATPRPAPERATPRRRQRRIRALSLAGAAAAVALAALVVGLTGGTGGSLHDGPQRAWAAPVLRVANAVPRLLVGEEGWTVSRADQFTVDQGEMTFTKGDRALDLHWYSDDLAARKRDRAADSKAMGTVDVPGGEASVFAYDEPEGDFTALWARGRFAMELRVGFPHPPEPVTIDEFRDLLGSLREVSVDEWLGAMPESVVLPMDMQEAVDRMLEGVPLPRSLDVSALSKGQEVRDRYQLGAHVTGAVACAWIERWIAARRSGDSAKAQAAVRAMQTSRRWPILNEMAREGFFPEAVWDYADAMAGDGTVLGGRPLTVEESYRDGLGCRG